MSARTNIQFLCVAVRQNLHQFNRPFFFMTSPRIESFMNGILSMTTLDFAMRLEGYMISGVDGTQNTPVSGILSV